MPLDNFPEPPPPPEAPRRIKLYRYQWIGVAALAAMPLLAVAGLFGESSTTTELRAGSIEVSVHSPVRMRYNRLARVEIRVRNLSAVDLDPVRITLDTAFASRFSAVHGIPELERPFEIALTRVPPGATGNAVIEMRAEQRGRHSGALSVTAGAQALRVPLNVLVYP